MLLWPACNIAENFVGFEDQMCVAFNVDQVAFMSQDFSPSLLYSLITWAKMRARFDQYSYHKLASDACTWFSDDLAVVVQCLNTNDIILLGQPTMSNGVGVKGSCIE